MALDFPANPTNGQSYGSYVYNSTVGAWQSKEDPATVAVTSSTAPSTANNGDIWYNTNTGVSYVYYADGSSAQWVEIVSSAIPLLNSKANLVGDNWFSGGVNYYGAGGLNGTFISSNTGRAQFTVNAASATPLMVRGTSSQTADLQQWQDSSAAVLADIDATGIMTAPRFISTQATGTAPFSVTSTTLVSNLNADLLDGQHASVYSPAGMISQFAGQAAPTGWLMCQGQEVAIASYTTLYNVLTATGTVFPYGANTNGSGAAGTTHFKLPDLQGEVPVGKSASGTFATLGGSGGVQSTSLTSAHIPQHSHSIDHDHGAFTSGGGSSHRHWISAMAWDDGNVSTSGSANSQDYGLAADAGSYSQSDTNKAYGRYSAYESGHTHSIDVPAFTGTSGNYGTATVTPVSAIQPYIVLNYIIKT